MRWLAPLIAALTLGVALAPGSHAAPAIDIKAQTQLVLEKVRVVDDGQIEVRGALVDRLTGTGDGLFHQRVTVRIGTGDDIATATVFTDQDGKFIANVYGAPPGAQPIELRYAGGGLIERAEPFTAITDPARAQVALTLRAEEAPGGANLIVTATIDDKPTELPVQLSFGPPTGDLAPLTNTRTGTPFLFTRARAGGAGTQRIRAAYAGDDARQPATAEVTLELAASTRTSMKLSATSLAYEDELTVTGEVADEDGRPVPRAAVTLSTGERRLAQGAAGANGAYRFEVEAEIIGQGEFTLKVRAEPASPAVRASDSPPATIKVAAPQPVPVSYTIAAFLATALAAGGFFTARAKPWRRFRRPAPPAEAAAASSGSEPTEGGLVVARPSLVSTLRRAHDDGFSGVVRDTVRGRPVPDASVRVLLPDGDRQTSTSSDGTFTFEHLPVGEHRAEVSAPGHVTERFAVSIPHRGELRGVRVDLVPVRERVFQLYRRAAEPVLPEPRLWGIWSPRQIVDHVRAQRPSPALATLTDFVEETYFSARIADEAILTAASERVDLAIRERARPGSVASAP